MYLAEYPIWTDSIRHFAANAALTGGPDCPDNLPVSDLANRTVWLKVQVESAQGGLTAHEAAADPHPQYLTAAEVDTAIAGGVSGYARLAVPQTYTAGQAGAVAPLPATTGTVTLDLAEGNNWEGTLTGHITLANPSTMPVGQSGVIRITQGATPYTIAYGSSFVASHGVLPSLTSSAGAVDLLTYYVETAGRIWIGKQGNSK